MPSTKRNGLDNSQAYKRLLIDGANSYLAAASAIMEYQKLVQTKCKAVLSKHLSEYTAALKIKLQEREAEPYAWPGPDEWTGTYTELGAYIVGKSTHDGIGWVESCCAFAWDYTDEASSWFGPWVGISLPRRLASEACNVLRPKIDDVQLDNKVVWVGAKLKASQVPEFDKTLEALLMNWMRAWRKLGGLKSIA